MRIKLNDPTLGVHDPDNGQEHAKIVPVLADAGLDPYVPNGAIIDVPAYIGGAGPHWRAPQEGDDLSWLEVTKNEDGSVKGVHDPGYGLLAQVDMWSAVKDSGEGDE